MKKILFYILFSCLVSSYGQRQAANWYFGENAGISFDSSNNITALDDGRLNTIEGCSSISDTDGNLLFYTDGSSVYTRQHTNMNNGRGLLGDASSSQSAIVIPRPDNPDIYYIFTVGANIGADGMKYSVVDMTGDGGLGEVTIKNVNLISQAAEKIAAVLKDCDSGEIWVIGLSNLAGNSSTLLNTYHAFEVTNAGVNTTPVKSNFTGGLPPITDARGYLKLSPDGTKLASASPQNGLRLYDFDVNTGIVSTEQSLMVPTANNSPYGAEFSPNSQVLYVSASNDNFTDDPQFPNSHFSVLVQYNLAATNISASAVIIDERNAFRSALQLGPDGRIFRTMAATYDEGTPFLSTINNPNEVGFACNYVNNSISLGNNNSTQGLPPFIASFFTEKIDIIRNGQDSTFLPLCAGDTYTLTADDIPGATYEWTLDGVLLPEADFDLVIDQSGTYELEIDLNNGDCDLLEGEAIVTYSDNPTSFDTTLIQCDEDDNVDGFTIFNLNEAYDDVTNNAQDVFIEFYESLNEAEMSDGPVNAAAYYNLSNPQIVFARVINETTLCYSISELSLEVSTTRIGNYQAPDACDEVGSEDGINTFDLDQITTDIQTENGFALPVTYYETYNDALLEQNELMATYANTTPYNQIIYTRVEDNNACYGIGEVILTVNTIPQLEEDETVLYCLNTFPSTITLDAGIINGSPNDYTYDWSSGQTTHEITVNTSGTYTVTVMNASGCSKSRTISVEPSNIATFESIDIVDASENNTITVIVSGEGEYEYALFDQDGNLYASYQTSNFFNNVIPGFYTVSVRDVKNNCGIVEDLVSVIGFPSIFTPNGDGTNDTWQVKGVSQQFQPNTKVLIYDRYGKLLKQLNPVGSGWDGTFNGQQMPVSDYWFTVQLQDGRLFRNHFTLKR